MSKKESDNRDIFERALEDPGTMAIIGAVAGGLLGRRGGVGKKELARLRKRAVDSPDDVIFRARQHDIYRKHGKPRAENMAAGAIVGGGTGGLGSQIYSDQMNDRRKRRRKK